MRKRNHIWVVLLAGLLSLGLMTGCGGGDGDDSSSDTAADSSTTTGDATSESAPSADATTDAAEPATETTDDTGEATPSFADQSPTGLRATKISGGVLLPATVELSCDPMPGANDIKFTTTLGTTSVVDASVHKVTVTVPVSEFGKKIGYSVYGVANEIGVSQTASSLFVVN